MFAEGGVKGLQEAEDRVLEYSGIPRKDVKSYEVKIKFSHADWSEEGSKEKKASKSFWSFCGCGSRNKYDGKVLFLLFRHR